MKNDAFAKIIFGFCKFLLFAFHYFNRKTHHSVTRQRILWLTKWGTRTGHECLNVFSPEKAGRVSRKGGGSPPQVWFSRQQSLEKSGILLNAIQGSLVTKASAPEFMPNRLLTLPGPPTLSQWVPGAGSRRVHPARGSVFLSETPAVWGLQGEDLIGRPSYLPLVPSGWPESETTCIHDIRVTPWDTWVQSSFLLYRLWLKYHFFKSSVFLVLWMK